jgi:hypothetical protein
MKRAVGWQKQRLDGMAADGLLCCVVVTLGKMAGERLVHAPSDPSASISEVAGSHACRLEELSVREVGR